MILPKKKYLSFKKRTALFLTAILLFETVFPTASFALTSGPSAPEFSSFEPVATTNMVNEFSGDFTYNIPVINIPGADGGGYALSLSYHSGETLESEASWVGYGWTLNPGAINRSKRGFADDSKAKHVFYNDVPKNWTASVGASLGDPELFSTDIPISLSAGLRYNNYKGFGYTAGIGLSVKGIVSLGYSVSDGSGSFSAAVNPAVILKAMKKLKAKNDAENKMKDANAMTDGDKKDAAIASANEKYEKKMQSSGSGGKVAGALGSALSSYGMHSFGDLQMPTSITPYTGSSFNVSVNVTLDPSMFPIGLSMGLSGNYSQQKNVATKIRDCFGYLYSNKAYIDAESMMDYYTEKDSPFNKRDQFMSIPFSNADQYSVTGEGLAGGFRLHSKNVGLFRPNAMDSRTTIVQIGAEANLGLNMGAGLDVGVGLQTLSCFGDRWTPGTSTSNAFTQYRFPDVTVDKENYFFRYSNDLGGDVNYGSDDVVTAKVVSFQSPNINTTVQPNTLASTIDDGGHPVSRSGRSSYIAYNTFKELRDVSNGKCINAYDNSYATNKFRPISASSKDYQIGEIATINEEGNTYVYGLTASSQGDKSISYSMEGATAVNNRFNAYKDISISNKMKVGTETSSDYATTYMLTQITTPDYVDRTLNGGTEDDFGGYTKFVYKKTQSAYHWRMPYTGFSYNKGNQSNQDDDMGSFSAGSKEIFYVDSIVTKTHMAKFYTSNRMDGLDAANDVSAGKIQTARGVNKLQKLDSICLYTNNNGVAGKRIKKTCFKYNYTLCANVPNSKDTISGALTGKLTLEKVWFEYEGVVQAKISPYIFNYSYVNPLTSYPYPYSDNTNPNQFNDYNAIITTGNQNPNYNFCDIDAWGNYQKNGATRYNNAQLNVTQHPDGDFDPAAWQLKRITLPSGGEIHIQYEQDDYQYVQDRRAMALVSLDPLSPASTATSNTFTLNVDADLGYHSPTEKQQLVNLINNELNHDKIYFKFLYTLLGSAVPTLNSCNAEYVSGYADFGDNSLGGTNGAIYNTVTDRIEITIENGTYKLPYHVCQDLVKKELGGKLNPLGNCNPSDGISDGGAAAVVAQLVSKMQTIFSPGSLCATIEPTLSYLKIPILKAKKGGGLRVKRILMYDSDGVDDGQPALYGSEYIYKLENGQSSGVATNEPATIREENPLVNFIPKRTNQTFLQKAISGVDKEQFEGPMGESILSAPSVGYSRIVTKNIHNGKTNTGFVVSEFYTDKDYPFDMNYGDGVTPAFGGKGVDNTQLNDETMDKFWLNIPAVYVNVSCDNYWAAQGYRFVKNNMHGQPKSVSTFGGDYLPGAPNLANKSSSTEYNYFLPGQKIPVMKDDGSTELKDIGKEVEVVMEARGVEDITVDANTEFDMSMGIIPPAAFIPNFSGSGSLSYSERKMYTHVTSKVINFPAIQKSVTQTQDGISHVTENMVFSRFTGKPVQTKSYDGFNNKNLQQSTAHKGIYTSYQVPGYTQYRELGQKAINQGMSFASTTDYNISFDASTTTLNFTLLSGGTPGALCDAIAALTVGDLICVPGSINYYFHVDGINGTSIKLLSSGNYNASSSFSSISSTGFKIIKSGRTNQLNVNVGNYTTYGDATTSSISTANLAARTTFVANLNAGLSSSFGSGVANSLILNSSNINFINPAGGGCLYSESQTYTLTVSTIATGGLFNIRLYFPAPNNNTEICTNADSYLIYPGHFILDNNSNIKYIQDAMPCIQYDVKCLQFCTPGGTNQALTNVIVSSANTMDYKWPYDGSIFDLGNLNTGKNDYETGAKGKWRTSSVYAYKESITGGAIENTSIHQRIYKSAGTFTMSMFNWKNPGINDSDKWVRTSTITKYSPNGSAIEEKDASHFYSTAKYGYQQTMPYLVAKNSTYKSVSFESFENIYPISGGLYRLEENLPVVNTNVTNTYAHSGKSSYILGATSLTFANSVLTSQMNTAGVSCKVWVKDPQRKAMPIKGDVNGTSFTFNKIAQTGEWCLYEAKITSWSVSVGTAINFAVTNNISGQPSIYIDDIRMQPLNTQVNTYVYDKVTKRLLTSFDDQHFGLYYQYNQEGKLVRKLIETEKGMKTIAETQYNTPKVSR